MGKIIVAQFVSLDGVTEDPDGSGGTPYGGWAFRNPAGSGNMPPTAGCRPSPDRGGPQPGREIDTSGVHP